MAHVDARNTTREAEWKPREGLHSRGSRYPLCAPLVSLRRARWYGPSQSRPLATALFAATLVLGALLMARTSLAQTDAQGNVAASVAPAEARFNPYRYFGIGADVGISGPLPDAGLLLIGRPRPWIYVHAGPTTNFLAFGVRGGLTLVNPFLVPVSLTCEGGHFFEGNVNRAKHWVSDDTDDIAALRNFGYDYFNLLVGLSLETRHVVFFVRGGTTWMRANISNFQRTVSDASKVDVQSSDPKLSYRGPSLRLGLLFFL